MIKNLIPTLAERGKIKIGTLGEKQKSAKGKEYRLPVRLDHFLITTMERGTDGLLVQDTALMQRLKTLQETEGKNGKLTEIPIRLLYDELDLNFQTRLACYKPIKLPGETKEHLGCWCSGDRETAQRLNSAGKYVEGRCPCERWEPTYAGPEKCRTLGTLSCLIDCTDRIGGVWKFRTGSWNSVNAIYASLLLIQTITGGGRLDAEGLPIGPLAGIPLKMVITPKSTEIPTTGQKTTIYVVSLEYAGAEDQLAKIGFDMRHKRVEHQTRMANLERQALKALAAPHEETPEEQAETAAEFAEPEINEAEIQRTREQDLADFAQFITDHDLAADAPTLLKFIATKATEHQTNSDEIRIAAAKDLDAFWEEFETFRAPQDPLGPETEKVLRSHYERDIAGLLAREGVRNFHEITATRAMELIRIAQETAKEKSKANPHAITSDNLTWLQAVPEDLYKSACIACKVDPKTPIAKFDNEMAEKLMKHLKSV